MDEVLLTLVLPPNLEDACIELLLEHPATPAFSSTPARGHGQDPDHLSVSEQVSGWRREVRIEVLVEAGAQADLLAALRRRLPTSAVRWWATPVHEAGDLGDAPEGEDEATPA